MNCVPLAMKAGLKARKARIGLLCGIELNQDRNTYDIGLLQMLTYILVVRSNVDPVMFSLARTFN